MSATMHPPPAACRNCGATEAADPAARYCSRCGQETALHPPTLGEFVHEFVGHYIALEGALWKTLALLVLKPGRLTREYFAGRRRRYVVPLRLYLTASFLFFLVVKLLPGTEPPAPAVHGAKAVEAGASAARPAAPAASRPMAFPLVVSDGEDRDIADCLQPQAHCGKVRSAIARAASRWKNDPQATEHFRSRFAGAVPYALFLMLPVFAAIVMLAYRNRRMLYGEHVVFSLHMHAFWFLAMLALWVLPEAAGGFGFLAVVAYGVWALHEVYGGRWRFTLLRAVIVSTLYSLSLSAATLGLVSLLFVFG